MTDPEKSVYTEAIRTLTAQHSAFETQLTKVTAAWADADAFLKIEDHPRGFSTLQRIRQELAAINVRAQELASLIARLDREVNR